MSDCTCEWFSEDRGGGYSELVMEFEPDCYEHGDPAMRWMHPSIMGQVSIGLFIDEADQLKVCGW